jgi:hypothetical protein
MIDCWLRRPSSAVSRTNRAEERVFGRFRRINEPDCKAVTLYANIDVRGASRAIQVRGEAAMHVEAAADNIP